MDAESWLGRRVGRTRYRWQAGLKSNTRWGVINVLQRIVLWGTKLSFVCHKNYEFWATVWTWRRRLLFVVSYRLSRNVNVRHMKYIVYTKIACNKNWNSPNIFKYTQLQRHTHRHIYMCVCVCVCKCVRVSMKLRLFKYIWRIYNIYLYTICVCVCVGVVLGVCVCVKLTVL